MNTEAIELVLDRRRKYSFGENFRVGVFAKLKDYRVGRDDFGAIFRERCLYRVSGRSGLVSPVSYLGNPLYFRALGWKY